MASGHAHDWRNKCYGRDELLKKLREAYRLTVAGMPQFLVLKGMTGVGKTRLAQELYRWLSTNEEIDQPSSDFPQGYWPDFIINEATKDRVNPLFDDRERPEIPFLWLGMKFDEPPPVPKNASPEVIQQLATAESGKALRDALPNLMPHAVQAIVKRDIRDVHGDWFWKAFSLGMTGLGMIPGVGQLASIPGWIKDGWELWKGKQKKRSAEAKAKEPVMVSQQQAERDAIDQTLNTLKLFLDSTQADLSTQTSTQIPVVLFLDDAHWGDALTLRLVKLLWAEAHSKKWPLLVVATHWDDEWDMHKQLPELPETPLKMAHFQQRVDPGGKVGGIRELPVCGVPAHDMRQWLSEALPGLPDAQQQLLLNKAEAAAVDADGNSVEGGSPRVLEHLLQLLLEDPDDAFVDGDSNRPIKDGFIHTIETELFDLNDIIQRRFKKLPREIRHALGWSSEQGRRFLCDINQAIARQLEDGPEPDAALAAIRQAEAPHHWIDGIPQTVRGESRYNLCEFRSNIFREVAKRNYSRDTNLVAAVRDALSQVLSGWLFAGRMNAPADVDLLSPEDLTIPERRDALQICVNHFRASDPENTSDEQWKVYGNALARLVELDVNGWRWGEPIFWDQALASAVEFATARPGGWDVSLVDRYWQVEVIDVLWQMRRFDLAERLLVSLHSQFETLRQSHADRSARRGFGLICERLATLRQAEGRVEKALSLHLESLQVRREIVVEFGRSPEALRDVSVSLNKVADAMGSLGTAALTIDGEDRDALSLYLESLQVRREIVVEFGRSPEALRDVFVSLDRVADAMGSLGTAALTIDGEEREALSLYLESLQICREIVVEVGRSPEALRDVSVSLNKVADAMRSLGTAALTINGEDREALSLYLDSLQVRREIVVEVGRSPEALRDVFVSNGKLAMLYEHVGDKETACKHLAECGRILDEIQQRGWADAQTAADLQWYQSFQEQLQCEAVPENG